MPLPTSHSAISVETTGSTISAETREQLRRADVYRDMHNLLVSLYESDDFRCLIGQETLDETERLIRESGGF